MRGPWVHICISTIALSFAYGAGYRHRPRAGTQEPNDTTKRLCTLSQDRKKKRGRCISFNQ